MTTKIEKGHLKKAHKRAARVLKGLTEMQEREGSTVRFHTVERFDELLIKTNVPAAQGYDRGSGTVDIRIKANGKISAEGDVTYFGQNHFGTLHTYDIATALRFRPRTAAQKALKHVAKYAARKGMLP
jgi:hypothetical protein